MAEKIAAGAAGEVYKDLKSSVSWFQRSCDYAKNPETYYGRMKEEANGLYKRRDDIEAEAIKDRRKQPSRECEYWIRRVDETKEKFHKLETKYENRNSLWPWSCLILSKHMVNMSTKLHDLWEKGGIFETRTAVERPLEGVKPEHAPKTEGKSSAHRFVEKIIDYLNDGKVRRIGLWGTPGIGKTTIMKNLNNDEKIAKMFNIVISVTVPRDLSIEKLQHDIAQRLKINLEGIMGTDETACIISENLKGKRYLLLLDEVQGFLNLNALGIVDNQMDSKVVLATRDRGTYVGMETNPQINVERLSNADAWKMFQEIVGPKINGPGIKPIARQVVRECARIPLLIDRVARTFHEMDDVHLWREGLDRLRRKPIEFNEFPGMHEVHEFLSICYERLEGDRQICFLYSALYPEDCQIYKDYLLECWKAEGLICEQGHTTLADLMKVSLLERSEKKKHITMNKVLRDMALRISSQRENSKVLVRDTHEKSEEPPDEKDWAQANRISLMDDKLRRLPEAPGCNNIFTLLLQRNSDLTVIPDLFFKHMQSLRVLDLHGIGITSLPESLSSLKSLRALYLNSCRHLMHLPPNIVALVDLELLDIRLTGINNLPPQIGSLIRLRCLRTSSSNFGAGHLISHNVISSLSSLEELSIDVDPYQQRWDEVGEAITKEVATLTKLTSLSFCFPKVDCLNIFITRNPSWKTNRLNEDNLFKFQFFVGYHDPLQYAILDDFEYEIDKCLRFVNGESVDAAISEVLAESIAFELIGYKGVLKLSDFGIESMNMMRGCLIEGCDEIKTIIDGNEMTEGVLKFLEKMYIKNVSKLESIWEGPVRSGSLVLLTTLKLQNCPKLKKLFSNGMIQQLFELQDLRVEDCLEIEEMIMESENDGLDSNALPRLKTLVLLDLPKLKSIWIDYSLKWSSLETIKILGCNSLKKLPFNNDNAAKLGSIECQESWWKTLPQEVAIPRLESIRIK